MSAAPEQILPTAQEVESALVAPKRKLIEKILDRAEDLESKVELWNHQNLSVKAIFNGVKAGQLSGTVKLPPRTGKTRLYSVVISELKLPTLVLTNYRHLVSEIKAELNTVDANITCDHIRRPRGALVTLGLYYGAVRAHRNGKLDLDRYDVVVLDEAHLALSAKRLALVEEFRKRGALIIAATATPHFNESKSCEKSYGHPYFTMSASDAIRDGLTAPPEISILSVDIDISNVPVIAGEFDRKSLNKAISSEQLADLAVSTYEALDRGEPLCCFCGSKAKADITAQKFNEKGYRAISITSDLSPDEQREAREKFEAGEFDVVTSKDLLVHGWNSKRLRVIYNLVPTTSQIRAEQRGFRPLTLDPRDPNKVGKIREFSFRDRGCRQVLFSEVVDGEIVRRSLPPREVKSRTDSTEKKQRNVVYGEIKTELIEAPEEVLAYTQKQVSRRNAELGPIPKNWYTLPEVAAKAGLSINASQKVLRAKMLSAYGGLNHTLMRGGFIAPQLARELVRLVERARAPEGWLVWRSLPKSFRIAPFLKELCELFPSEISLCLGRSKYDYYLSPLAQRCVHEALSGHLVGKAKRLAGIQLSRDDWTVMRLWCAPEQDSLVEYFYGVFNRPFVAEKFDQLKNLIIKARYSHEIQAQTISRSQMFGSLAGFSGKALPEQHFNVLWNHFLSECDPHSDEIFFVNYHPKVEIEISVALAERFTWIALRGHEDPERFMTAAQIAKEYGISRESAEQGILSRIPYSQYRAVNGFTDEPTLGLVVRKNRAEEIVAGVKHIATGSTPLEVSNLIRPKSGAFSSQRYLNCINFLNAHDRCCLVRTTKRSYLGMSLSESFKISTLIVNDYSQRRLDKIPTWASYADVAFRGLKELTFDLRLPIDVLALIYVGFLEREQRRTFLRRVSYVVPAEGETLFNFQFQLGDRKPRIFIMGQNEAENLMNFVKSNLFEGNREVRFVC